MPERTRGPCDELASRRARHESLHYSTAEIRSEATEFRYERETQPLPTIGPWRDRLDALLLENDGKPAREPLTFIRLFEEFRGLDYGSPSIEWQPCRHEETSAPPS